MDERRREEIALFRYQVIAPLLSVEPERGALKRAIEGIASKTWDIPFSDKTSIGFGTVEHWLYRYRAGSLPALKPAQRADAAKSRKITGNVAQAVEELLAARPHLSSPLVLKELKARGLAKDKDISLSCLQRFRKTSGMTPRGPGNRRDIRAFEFEFPGDCWQCDLLYGPSLPTPDGRRRKTYLYAVIDDASRVICHRASLHTRRRRGALPRQQGSFSHRRPSGRGLDDAGPRSKEKGNRLRNSRACRAGG